jgi:predicted DNA-binding transcriptional regulator AlpA
MRGLDGNPIGLTPKELAERLQLTYKTLYNWRRCGIGPRFYKIRNEVYYKNDDIEAWIASCRN